MRRGVLTGASTLAPFWTAILILVGSSIFLFWMCFGLPFALLALLTRPRGERAPAAPASTPPASASVAVGRSADDLSAILRKECHGPNVTGRARGK
jgi:hypothetical protein